MGSIRFLSRSFHIFRIRSPTIFQLALSSLSPIQPYQLMLAISFLASFSIHIEISTLSRLFVSSGYSLSSDLCIVILVVFEHLRAFTCCHLCTAFSCCCANFVLPSHNFPAHCRSGTITLIIMHTLILVSMCQSVRIASILTTCAFPFPITFAVCIPRAVCGDIYAKACILVYDR